MFAHKHIGLYRAIRAHFGLADTEFLYYFLTGDPQIHRALTDRVRGQLGLHGTVNALRSPNWPAMLLLGKALSPITDYADAVANLMEALKLIYEWRHGPLLPPQTLTPYSIALIRHSPVARLLIRVEDL